MPAALLAQRMQLSGDLPQSMTAVSSPPSERGPAFTAEQLIAIERRDGDLLLDAGAGSGKTSVLVERFARAVLEDGVDVSAILAITFTDKAAAELRDRIRTRLRELGAEQAARATEGAFISTIHGFCARVLRTHALAAGIDPAFAVLEQSDAERLADAAFDDALEDLGQNAAGGVELIASYAAGPLRGAILGAYAELRSRGARRPTLPRLPAAPDLDRLRDELERAAARAADELGGIAEPSTRVVQALERLERLAGLIASTADPWPGELDQLALPGGNGAALITPACVAYAEALVGFRAACEHRRAQRAHALLNRLLIEFGARYAERKRDCSALDFEDLELMTRELLLANELLRARLKARFDQIMVDELQDTNGVQLELIELIARENLFTVGDAMQSIYGFRHADVEQFERRGARLAQAGRRATLQTNFRSRPEILRAVDAAFTSELGEHFTPLLAGRIEPPAADALVELLVADKGADWEDEGLAAPWRLAEARALAARIQALLDAGASPREIVVLTRATTDLRAYERALEDLGIPTYVIGGRGYWSHPQVVDVVAYLRALANPRDEEALYTVLLSPLVGVSVDALVVLADSARAAAREPWWILREPEGRLDELPAEEDRAKLAWFAAWFAGEREAADRAGVDELVQRALERTGYDLAILAMLGGRRRLANVRKLMRLGREYEAGGGGRDLRGFLDLARGRAEGWSGSRDARESEAPVEGEALDAVRLLTIHRAKGLEFEIVCVADLGRAPRRGGELLRVGRDGRLGLRLAEPGTGKRTPALDYRALGDEQARREDDEERRLFYVAMTRARERLILSGAVRLESVGNGAGGCPMAWIARAFVPEIAALVDDGRGTTDAGVRWSLVRPGVDEILPAYDPKSHSPLSSERFAASSEPLPAAAAEPAPTVATLSYSALAEYRRCGYRFYAERVLGLPPVHEPAGASASWGDALTGAERGILVHALLERLDFRRPTVPSAEAILAAAQRAGLRSAAVRVDELAGYVEAFAASDLCGRLAHATHVRREERFAFLLDPGVLITGALDVLAREPDRGMLVVDYKSDRLEGAQPDDVVAREYAAQRAIYALAVLRAGAPRVEVVHVFLEAPDRPVSAAFTRADAPALERELEARSSGVLQRRFAVSDAPHRGLCAGCPAEGGLCSWPLALTRREAPDRLF